MDINIFTQIGFVVLVGLASKNAILIVEFAKQQRESGETRRQATLEACRLRLRPIVMTSFAFILGVAPLMLAHGAGAEMRQTLGTAVFSGMLGVTLFGIFLTPVFFYHDRLAGRHAAVCFADASPRRRAGARRCFVATVARARAENAATVRLRRIPVERRRRAARFRKTRSAVFSNFFIDRPIFAACCRSSSRWPAALRCSRCRSRSIRRSRRRRSKSRRLSRRECPVVADTVAAPIEAAGQRRRRHAVHVVAVHATTAATR